MNIHCNFQRIYIDFKDDFDFELLVNVVKCNFKLKSIVFDTLLDCLYIDLYHENEIIKLVCSENTLMLSAISVNKSIPVSNIISDYFDCSVSCEIENTAKYIVTEKQKCKSIPANKLELLNTKFSGICKLFQNTLK